MPITSTTTTTRPTARPWKEVLAPALAIVLCSGTVVSAEDIRWTGAANDGDWNNADNWESYDPDAPTAPGEPVDGPPGEDDCVWIPDYDDDFGPTMPPVVPEHDPGDPEKNGIRVGSIRIGDTVGMAAGDGTVITPPGPGKKVVITAVKAEMGDVVIEEGAPICASDGTPAHPDGADVCIESMFGSVTNNGMVKGGAGHGAVGDGGGVDIDGRGPVSNGGSIAGGSGRDGGGVDVDSDGGGVRNGGSITGGGGARDGGDVDVDTDGGDVDNGGTIAGGNGGRHGGGVKIGSDEDRGTPDNVKNDGEIKGGDGGARDGKSGGDGGCVGVDARDDIDNGPGGMICGGRGGNGSSAGDGDGPGAGGSVTGRIGTDGKIDNQGKVKGGDGGDAAEDSGKEGGGGGDIDLKGRDAAGRDVGDVCPGDAQPGKGGLDDPQDPATPGEDRGPAGEMLSVGRLVVPPLPGDPANPPRAIRLISAEPIDLTPLAGRPLLATETITIQAPRINMAPDRLGLLIDPGVQSILAGDVALNPGAAIEDVAGGTVIRDPAWLAGVPLGATIEPEPCGELLNGGCDDGTGFTGASWGDTVAGGVFALPGRGVDTDWYRFTGLRDSHESELSIFAEFDALVLVFDGPSCDTGGPALELFVAAGEELLATTLLTSDEVLVAVMPAGGDVSCDGGNRYTLTLAAGEPVAPCYADFDGDGELTFFDFLAFQNAFVTGDTAADCNGDGVLNIFDFLCFQNAFVAGCG